MIGTFVMKEFNVITNDLYYSVARSSYHMICWRRHHHPRHCHLIRSIIFSSLRKLTEFFKTILLTNFICLFCLISGNNLVTVFKVRPSFKFYRTSFFYQMFNKLNPFVPNEPFLYPWKHQETIRFSNVLRVSRKGALGTNGLNTTIGLQCLPDAV